LWQQDRAKVLQHVSNDSYATMMVLKQTELTGTLPWITQKGYMKVWNDVKFSSVKDCLSKELPVVPYQIAPSQNAKLLARWLLYN
jgi:hypothetical protein